MDAKKTGGVKDGRLRRRGVERIGGGEEYR